MLRRREFWVSAWFAAALLSLSAPSCTPDERSLLLGLRSPDRGDAGSAESEALAGFSGSADDDHTPGQAGDSDGAGAPAVGGSAGTHPSSGGTAGASGNGGTSNGGTSAGASGNGGTSNGGNAGHAGAPLSGPCGDINENAIDDCTETLVQNSRFDSNVEHWTTGSWDSRNARAASGSGSLSVLNDSPVVSEAGFKLTAADQCLQVTGNFEYEVAARVLIPAGQGTGYGSINLGIYANDDCKGTFVTALTPATTHVIDAWTVVAAKFRMPTAARSMIVRLAATRPYAQTKLQVLFDDVLVKQNLLLP